MTDTDPTLQALLDQQAIEEVIVRYFRGVDSRDVDLVGSAYHPDAVDTRGARTLEGPGIAEALIRSNAKSMVATRHHVTTHSIEVSGDTATSLAYCLGIHVAKGEPPKRLQTSSRYVDRLDRRDGAWRILHREVFMDMLRAEPLEKGAPESGANWTVSR